MTSHCQDERAAFELVRAAQAEVRAAYALCCDANKAVEIARDDARKAAARARVAAARARVAESACDAAYDAYEAMP